MSRLFILLFASLAVGACGDQSTVSTASDGSVTARCGQQKLASASPDFSTLPLVEGEKLVGLEEMLNGPEGEFMQGFTYYETSSSGAEVQLIGTRSDQPNDLASVTLKRVDGSWRAVAWGGCSIELAVDGMSAGTMILDPDREPDRSSAVVPVLVQERECASGRPPTDREVRPVVTETDDQVEIAVFIEPVSGSADCPGNPWHPIEIRLDAPLGERAIFDVARPPAAERSWPPSDQELAG